MQTPAPSPAADKEAPGGSEQTIGVTDTEVVIGSCAPLSGQMKERGSQVVSGGRTYFSYINDKGGVNGRKIRLISCDDKYDVNTAIECFNANLKDKVFMGALFQGTAAATKYVKMAEANRMPAVGFSTGGEFITNPLSPYVFQVRASYFAEAAEQINALSNSLSMKRVALVYQNDAYGAACREGVNRAMGKLGTHPVAEVSIPRLTHNLDPVLKSIAESKPDAVILGVAGDALSLLAERRADMGSNVQLVAFSVGTDLLMKEAEGKADGALITQVMPLTQSKLATVQLYKKLVEKYEHNEPTMSGFEGFVIGMVIVEGLRRAGKNLTRDGFIKAMESIHNFDVGLGPKFKITYRHDDHEGFSAGVYWTGLKGGKLENVNSWKSFMANK
jgi:ABC-type branched-subunit amino acid transport system substrate-binding protein